MTIAPSQSPVTQGLRSLEVRWILPGRLQPAVAGWFGRFPAETVSRQDAYLLGPQLGGLSVKIRAGTALEVKVYRGSPGILDVASRARGRIESWQKWSFPCSPLNWDSSGPAGWRMICKTRRITRFWLTGERAVTTSPGRAAEPACTAELTDIQTGHHAWWSLGLEATGPADRLHNALHSTAAQLFAQPLPGDVELDMSHCQSYAQWLSWHQEPRVTEAPARYRPRSG